MHSIRDAYDDVLCKRCVEGDPEAWEKLVTEYGGPMRDLIGRLLGGARHRALDDVFLEFWWILLKDHGLVLRRFEKEKGTLTAYFAGVARNLVRKNLRRESSRAKHQVSLSDCSPDHFPVDDLPLSQVINELESQATNAERRFLRDWLLQSPGSEAQFSETNRRKLNARLLDKAWPVIHGGSEPFYRSRHGGDSRKSRKNAN